MCATCYWCILDRCISLASKARESNFYTTLWTHRCAGEFSSSCPCRIEERAKGKRWMVMPLCRQTRGISLSRIERVESSEGEGRGRATLSPCPGEPAIAGDEHLKALIPAIVCMCGMAVPPACDGCWSMVDFQAIDHCSDAGNRGHGRQEFFYLVCGNGAAERDTSLLGGHINGPRLGDYVPHLCSHPCHQDCVLGYLSPSELRLRLCNQAIGALACVVGSLTDELSCAAPVGLCLIAYERTTPSAQPGIEHIHYAGAEPRTAKHQHALQDP